MANVLKCNVCNIVIIELLSYVQNKVSVVDEETLVRICVSSFTAEEIKNAKSLLFESIPTDKRKILRKNKGKEERDLADIINIFKSAEPDIIPIFVARQLEKLPPILFDHLDCSKLLKDILLLKNEITDIKSTYATLDELTVLKNDLMRVRHDSLPPPSAFKINLKRGAWMDSGPMGLSHDSTIKESYVDSNSDSLKFGLPLSQYRQMRVAENKHNGSRSSVEPQSVERDQSSAGIGGGVGGTCLPVSQEVAVPTGSTENASTTIDIDTPTLPTTTIPQITEQLTAAYNVALSKQSKNTNNEQWQTVNRRKQSKYRFIGKSGVARDLECSFATESDIVKHIYNKTQESVTLEKIIMKLDRGHKAYKFFISEANLYKYLDETLWPSGVIFRRFVHFRHRKFDVNNDNGSKRMNNE